MGHDINQFLRDLEKSRDSEVIATVPESNFFAEPYPLAIVDKTIGLRAYVEWLLAPQCVPEPLVAAVSAVPESQVHTILSANAKSCLQQLTQLGVTRGQWRFASCSPVLAHLAYMWLQWEHDTARVHSSAHIAQWEHLLGSQTRARLSEIAGTETPGVEPWYGIDLDESDAWARLQPWVDHQLARGCFDHFILSLMPSYIFEEVHAFLSRVIEEFTWRRIRRVILNVPPRAGKSQQTSILAPPWQIAQAPWSHLMSVSYARQLARRFGMQARSILFSSPYQALFPHVKVDKGEAGEWVLKHDNILHPHGEYYASGIEGGIAGRGYHIGVTDDLLNEQTMYSQLAKDKAWDWWYAGFLTREMDPSSSSIGVISTRYAHDDPVGRLLKEEEGAAEWSVVKIPALLKTEKQVDLLNSYRIAAKTLRQRRENLFAKHSNRAALEMPMADVYKIGSSFSPIRRDKVVLERLRRRFPSTVWLALYDQEPSAAEGNIILRDWWKPWPFAKPPKCKFRMSMLDTAYEEVETADFSARTMWGVFDYQGKTCVILLGSWRDRVSFPKLRDETKAHYHHDMPDVILVEAKASGKSLVQELANSGYPVREWLPPGQFLSNRSRGKIPRAHATTPVFEAGLVFYLDIKECRDVIDECSVFPNGEHDDWTDTTTGAILYLRGSKMLRVPSDYDERRDANPEAVEDYQAFLQSKTVREQKLNELGRRGTNGH